MSRHEVGGFNATQAHHVVVRTTVTHHTNALHREEDHEGLAHLVVEVRCAEFLNEDGIGFTEEVSVFALHFTQNTNA